MRRTSVFVLALWILSAASFGQSSPDSQITQALLTEIRLLREQSTAATIQRVQLLMYRVQAGAASLGQATQRFENARAMCRHVQSRKQQLTTQIEQLEALRRNPQNPADQKDTQQTLHELKSSMEALSTEEQLCQVEQVESETQLRAEQSKMNELQDQLINSTRFSRAMPRSERQ